MKQEEVLFLKKKNQKNFFAPLRAVLKRPQAKN